MAWRSIFDLVGEVVIADVAGVTKVRGLLGSHFCGWSAQLLLLLLLAAQDVAIRLVTRQRSH